MDISIYFSQIDISSYHFQQSKIEKLGHIIDSYNTDADFPVLNEEIDLAIFGVCEDRGSIDNKGCDTAPYTIRENLYNLTLNNKKPVKIVDLGNVKTGETLSDTYIAIGEIVAFLLQKKIIPIILGGSQDITVGNYRGYENLGQIINMFNVDSRIDLGEIEENNDITSENYLTHIMCGEPNYLFNYTHVAYQTYFIDYKALETLEDLYFDCYRLGVIQDDIECIEPLIRNADMVTVDVSAIRSNYERRILGNDRRSPHGLYGEQLCQLCRYAGMSDKLTSIGFYEINSSVDNGYTSAIVAHAIWYFIDGYLWRKKDFPYVDTENYFKFVVSMNEGDREIIFYKSKKSERWWIEVPCSKDLKEKYKRHYLVPCSYQDYVIASEKNRIPDRWFKAYNKMSL